MTDRIERWLTSMVRRDGVAPPAWLRRLIVSNALERLFPAYRVPRWLPRSLAQIVNALTFLHAVVASCAFDSLRDTRDVELERIAFPLPGVDYDVVLSRFECQ